MPGGAVRVGFILAAACATASAGAASAPGVPPHVAKPSAQAEARVVAQARRGRLTDGLIVSFFDYAQARAREACGRDSVPADFWRWLSARRSTREGLLVGLHPAYNPNAVKCLQQLRERFGSRLDRTGHLAVAFALAWADGEPLRPRFVRRDRPCPSMMDSFRYYQEHCRDMLVPLDRTPWPLLAYVAANDVPIKERLWAIRQYGKRRPATWAKIYGEPRYGRSGIRGLPKTLPNILEHGGVCSHRSYYACAVLRSLGVPSARVTFPGHAWVTFIMPKDGRHAAPCPCHLGHLYEGRVRCPVRRQRTLVPDFRLLVAAVDRSYESLMKAWVACYAWDVLGADPPREAAGLLASAVRLNPYCAEAWRRIAGAGASGAIRWEASERLCTQMLAALSDHPDLSCEVIETIWSGRIAAGEAAEAIRARLAFLDRAARQFQQFKPPWGKNPGRGDLCLRIALFQGSALAALGRRGEAAKCLADSAHRYAARVRKRGSAASAFGAVLGEATRLMGGTAKPDAPLRFLYGLAPHCRRRGRTIVLEAVVQHLLAAGRADEAEAWKAKLKGAHADDPEPEPEEDEDAGASTLPRRSPCMTERFDPVAWMRNRRAQIDQEDHGLTWEQKSRKTADPLEGDPLWERLKGQIARPPLPSSRRARDR